MVIDLSQFDFKKKPTLILRNPDETAIGVLGTAYNIQLKPHYNEVSELEFDLSAYDAVMRTPHYDQVIGLRIVDLKGIGQFVLNNPKITNAGAWETKHCTAYSLEREFIRKDVYLEKNVYNFWNPVSPDGTVLGIIMEKFPNWSVGKVDSDLIGKYRSLDDTDDNAYNVMKSTLQEAYGCIFDFDTYRRKVNVVSAASDPTSLPVFFSLDNLIKQLEIEEDDENIATCLGVYGADGLSIGDVNPMGGAKIYNFDYFMTETNFAPATIEKYQAWKAHFEAVQEPFYNLTVEQALKESQVAAESARLTDMQGELKALEGVQASWVELLASHDYSGKTLEDGTPADEEGVQAELDKVNGQIIAKKQEISAQQAVVDSAKAKADQLQAERKAIVDGCQFETFFTAEEILQLDHYITENSIEESSFVASEVKNYNAKDTSLVVNNATVSLYGSYNDKGTVAFAELPAVSKADCNSVYHIASGDKHHWDSALTRIITPALKKEASAIVNKGTDTKNHELSGEFSAFVKVAQGLYVENTSGKVVDDSSASIRYLANGILSVGQRPESLTAETYFLTTADFVDGTGIVYPAGVSVAVQGNSRSKKYKVLPSGFSMTEESAITSIQRASSTIYSLTGGRFSLSAGSTSLDADVVRVSVEVMTDKSFTLSAYLNSGTMGSTTFPSGTVVLTGKSKSVAGESAKLTLNIKEARFYFTQNLTEWERRSVAWDLFQYGQEILEKVSQPSYSFTVDSADFLVMDEFEAFKNALSLGKRVYLKLDDGRVLTPMLLGFSHTFDEKSGLTLEFSNKFTSKNKNDQLVYLLKQSVSMGKKMDLNREINAFTQSHANTAIHDFMNGALDVAKNTILSATGQAIFWDENGLRLCKWNSDRTGYEDEQIWMKDNLIVFTEDSWEHAKMAIGHIHDKELGDLWGVIADSIVGRLLAGENLIIMGTDATGKKTLFRVDGSGMYAYNSRFWMESPNGGAFAVDPSFGLGLGQGNPFAVGSDGTIVPKCIDTKTGALKLDKDGFPVGMNFWAGLDGQVYIRGNVYATDGVFNGTVYATDGEFKGIVKATDFQLPSGDSMVSILNNDKKIKSDWLDLLGINIKDTAGNIMMTIDGTNGITINKGSISWGAVTGTDEIDQRIQDVQDIADDAYSEASSANDDLLKLVKGNLQKPGATFINGKEVSAPTIRGGKIYGAQMYANEYNIYPLDDTEYTGSFNLYGNFGGRQYQFLEIAYGDSGLGTPNVTFDSPNGATAEWGFNVTRFTGKTLDFSLIDSISWGKNRPTAVFA